MIEQVFIRPYLKENAQCVHQKRARTFFAAVLVTPAVEIIRCALAIGGVNERRPSGTQKYDDGTEKSDDRGHVTQKQAGTGKAGE